MRVLLLIAATVATTSCATVANVMYPGLAEDVARQGTVEETYDEFRDARTWQLVPMSVAGIFMGGRNDAELRMGALAVQTGPAHPEAPNEFSLVLYFSGTSSEWQYLRSRLSVDFIIDGERLHLGEADHDGDVGRGFVMEHMPVRITREQLLQIAEAQTVAGQLAHTRFDLHPTHLERIRGFLAALPPAAAAVP